MKPDRKFWGWVGLMLVTGVACSMPWSTSTPAAVSNNTMQVTISSPAAGQTFEPDQSVNIQSTSVDTAKGIVRVELMVDNNIIWIDANPDPQPNMPYIVAQPWTPEILGSHTLQLRAYNVDNVAKESEVLVVQVSVLAQSVVNTPAAMQTAQTGDTLPTATVASIGSAPTPTPAVTVISLTPQPVCTPPPCKFDEDEIYFCPDQCPGGCGTTCATVTPLPTATLNPTVTPTPGSFNPTGLQPEGRFKDIWQTLGGGEGRLGYPTAAAIVDRNFARQYFDRGLMFWWDDPQNEAGLIWVIDSPAADLKSGATSNFYIDAWESDDEFSCDAARANGNFGPIRGFGKVWCEQPGVQARLGNPRDYEGGSGGQPPFAQVQFFQGGVMIYNSLDAVVFVLFDQGDWTQFKY